MGGVVALKKRLFYPIWKLETLEAELAQMERQGWRLCKLFGMHGYEFIESQPKETQYLLTYNNAKGSQLQWQRMHEIEYTIKSQIGGNPVGEDAFSGRTAFRITQTVDLRDLKRQRNQCLQGFLRYHMLLMLLPASLCAVLMLCMRDASWLEIAFIGVCLIFYFAATVYYFIAWRSIKQKLRRENI